MAYQLIKVRRVCYSPSPVYTTHACFRPDTDAAQALRAEDVEYIVAPYEADAQLCMLEREGIVDGIITEDSDLLVFGCKQVSDPRFKTPSSCSLSECIFPN
jgi:exonuclease-1